mmetsp:Transcript_25316/g.52004  ORF Transcript_25316/g.52004 Transcript_25316/m.52004 type:complete len:230 (-) Transcript_25316:267-956(-)
MFTPKMRAACPAARNAASLLSNSTKAYTSLSRRFDTFLAAMTLFTPSFRPTVLRALSLASFSALALARRALASTLATSLAALASARSAFSASFSSFASRSCCSRASRFAFLIAAFRSLLSSLTFALRRLSRSFMLNPVHSSPTSTSTFVASSTFGIKVFSSCGCLPPSSFSPVPPGESEIACTSSAVAIELLASKPSSPPPSVTTLPLSSFVIKTSVSSTGCGASCSLL